MAGVLDKEPLIEIVESLSETAYGKPGDRVKTQRGSLHGKIIRILDGGRLVWKPDGATSELIALPASLRAEKKGKG